jgi:hypothetical protein
MASGGRRSTDNQLSWQLNRHGGLIPQKTMIRLKNRMPSDPKKAKVFRPGNNVFAAHYQGHITRMMRQKRTVRIRTRKRMAKLSLKRNRNAVAKKQNAEQLS